MAKQAHSEPGPKTSSHDCYPKQDPLRNPVAVVGGFPFVYPEQAKGNEIDKKQIQHQISFCHGFRSPILLFLFYLIYRDTDDMGVFHS